MEHLTFSPGGELGLLKKAVEANRDSMAFASLFNFLPTGTCLVWCDPGSIQESAEDYLIDAPEEDPYYLDWDQVLQKALGSSFDNHSLEPTSPLPGDPHALGFSEEKGWSLSDPQMESMSHYRPMGTIRPEMHVMEAQRKDFMEQMHRWLRQVLPSSWYAISRQRPTVSAKSGRSIALMRMGASAPSAHRHPEGRDDCRSPPMGRGDGC